MCEIVFSEKYFITFNMSKILIYSLIETATTYKTSFLLKANKPGGPERERESKLGTFGFDGKLSIA